MGFFFFIKIKTKNIPKIFISTRAGFFFTKNVRACFCHAAHYGTSERTRSKTAFSENETAAVFVRFS